jgi:hypothetical protein
MSNPGLEPDQPFVHLPASITIWYNMVGALILPLIFIFCLAKNVWSCARTPHTSLTYREYVLLLTLAPLYP